MNFTLTKIEDWQEVINSILPKLQHNILLLNGNLGAGKTTFTQFLLKNLGSTDEISSPTYSIVNEYNTPKGKIYHFDLYRLKSIEEVYDIGMGLLSYGAGGFILPFEVISILLLAAMIGAIIIGKGDKLTKNDDTLW